MNRTDAARLGALTYDPANPCVRGHTSPRYTKSGACLECLAEDKAARHLARSQSETTWSVKCHPDDAQVLSRIAQHLAALRRPLTPAASSGGPQPHAMENPSDPPSRL